MLFQLRGDRSVIDFLQSYSARVQEMILLKWQEAATRISDRVKEKLSGEVLSPKTGRLRASIVARVYTGKSHVTLSLGSRGDVPYAALHEYGGTVLIPSIVPVKRSVLMFYTGYAKVFAKRTAAHVVHMPERSYVRSTMNEMIPSFSDLLIDAAIEAAASRRRSR